VSTYTTLDAQLLDDDDTRAVTNLRSLGRDDTPNVPYRGGAMRRRHGIDDELEGAELADPDGWVGLE
jgi:hypothetical protein